MKALARHFALLFDIVRLPVADLCFHSHLDRARILETYRYFTKPHPRYRVIQNKSVGAALIGLRASGNRDCYLETIKGKNQGGWHAHRARARGYVVAEIERNDFIDDIHAINTSMETRQGLPMAQNYLQKVSRFETVPSFHYFGALDAHGKLMAYANLGVYGNFAAFSHVIGHRNNHGITHLLVVEIACRLIDEGALDYLMYDTFFGASDGLQNFKTTLGFTPYRARYRLQ